MLATIKRGINVFMQEAKASYYEGRGYEAMIAKLLRKHHMDVDLYVVEGELQAHGLIMGVYVREDLMQLANICLLGHSDTVLIADMDGLRRQCIGLIKHNKLFIDATLYDIVTIYTAHELAHIHLNHAHSKEQLWKKELILSGVTVETHFSDYMKMGQMTINQEYEAWHAGRVYVPEHLLPQYEEMNRLNIGRYKRLFNKQLDARIFI